MCTLALFSRAGSQYYSCNTLTRVLPDMYVHPHPLGHITVGFGCTYLATIKCT